MFAGSNGALIRKIPAIGAGDRFGWSVACAGDLDADGFDEVIVGALTNDNPGLDSGHARVFSGSNGAQMYAFEGDGAGDHFGTSVSGAGDVNGDGTPDLVVGAPPADPIAGGMNSGLIRIFSGVDGSEIATYAGLAIGDGLGAAVDELGDINGDGFDDVIAGAALGDSLAGADAGYIFAYSVCGHESYGSCGAIQALSMQYVTALDQIEVTGGTPFATMLLLVSLDRVAGCPLLVDMSHPLSFFLTTSFNAIGEFSLVQPLQDPGLAGFSFSLQALELSSQLVTSNGVQVVFCN